MFFERFFVLQRDSQYLDSRAFAVALAVVEANSSMVAAAICGSPRLRGPTDLLHDLRGVGLQLARLRLLLLVHEHGEEDPVVLLEGIDVVLMEVPCNELLEAHQRCRIL